MEGKSYDGVPVGHQQGLGTCAADQAERYDTIHDTVQYTAPVTTWSSGICDCTSDLHNTFDVCICGTCVLSQQFNRVYNEQQGIHWPVCLSMFGLTLCAHSNCSCWPNTLYILALRQEIKCRYGIDKSSNWSAVPSVRHPSLEQSVWAEDCRSGAICTDFCLILWCTPCVICQQHRELTVRGDWPSYVLFGKDPVVDALEAPSTTHIV